jgi:Zn-dependent protease with chaperone function
MSTPSRSAYVISTQDLAPGWVLLYAITFGLQIVAVVLRFFFSFMLLWLLLELLGRSASPAEPIAEVIAWGPLVLSFATLLLPVGGWFWQQQSGGRAPSERERLIYDDAIAVLRAADPGLRPPRRWFVLDEPFINAAAYASTLMLTRGLLESGYLEPVLAHELGHLNSSDSRLTAALHRLTTPPRRRLGFPFATIGFLASGGLGIWLTRMPWAAYWRAREFAADQYAAKLGQGQALARFLDTNALENDLPVPFMWLTEHSHPATEHRIDRLFRRGR